MRKITGYIGALIIVFALMGSILMGYALNVNGNTAIINDYEKVTDVSGLYTHTQEPSYIEYNPASNYIGYDYEKPFNSSVGDNNYYKSITNNIVIVCHSDGTVTYDNKTVTPVYVSPTVLFFTEWGWIHYNINSNILQWRGYNSTDINGDVTINITGNNVDITFNGTTKTITANNKIVVSDSSSYDYYYTFGALWNGVDNGKIAYFKDKSEIIGSTITGGSVHTFIGETYYYLDGGQSVNATWPFTINNVESGIYSINPYYGMDLTVTFNGNNYLSSGLFVLYPKVVYKQELGINYTESNRVNNYLMETTYTGGTTSVTTRTLNLSPGMGLTDYARAMDRGEVPRFWRVNQYPYDYNGTNTYIGMPTYTAQNTGGYTDNIRTYKLTDILNYYNITSDKPITVSCYGTTQYSLSNGEVIGDNNFVKMTGDWPYGSAGYLTDKWYCVYDPNTGIYDYYNSSNVKMQTRDNCYVSFCGNQPRYGPMINGSSQIVGYYDFGTRTTPYLNITYETEIGGTTTYHYADITKGFTIKSQNMADTIWDNEYSNGNIQILFRADYPTSNYHNDIIVGDNNISVDYTNGGYYITLNSGDPVNIGKWRNIVLDIDLRNGELTAIPVRTFNSFSNVVLDVTNIKIGDLVNATPTNIIKWAPTSNSLMFNVYSTSVFMDTYGVVMVDPTLNITEYFTDLDNFYKLRLYNFSIIGDSVTINDVNADVIGENITINEQTVRIKEMAITYVDNHVYISDSNVNIDLGEITDNIVSMSGNWYFETELLKGFTSTKMVYNWNWEDFILDNTQFCIMYMGIALIALIIARHYCTLSLTDYIVLILSFAIAITVQVIA